MKIHPVKAMKDELFHADRRTKGQADMTNLIDTFRISAKAPKRGEGEGEGRQRERERQRERTVSLNYF